MNIFNKFMNAHPLLGAAIIVLSSFFLMCSAVWCEHNGYGMCEIFGLK